MKRRLDMTVAAVAGLLFFAGVSSAQDKGDKSDDKKQCMAASETGQNQRDDGHYRAARQSFLACTRDVCPKVVAQSCTRWLRELDQDTPTVVLGAKDDQGNDLTDVKVSFDGEPLATVLDGKPLGVDSGEHVLRFEREGSVPFEQKLVLRAGEKARVVTVVMHSVNAPAATVEPEPAKPPPPAETAAPEPLLSAHNVTAGVMGIAALAAAGVGVLFLVESGQAKTDASNLRNGLAPNACSHSGPPATCQSLSDKVNTEHEDANLATGLFIGAGALAAGAVITWLVWPHDGPTEPQTTGWLAPVPGGATVNLRGSFE
jgi:hypothetical protein